MLRNGDFSEKPWDTLPAIPEAGGLRNQQPAGWQLSWLDLGQTLYADSGATANGIPECVHKLEEQLPPNEQLGAPDALILAGDATYKIFSATSAFGATLSQTVTDLEPGSEAILTVPIQLHLHGDMDGWSAESGVWVNGVGGWANAAKMGDRQWYRHEVKFTVPDDGQAEILIRVKSKWNLPKDFFLDGITLEAKEGPGLPPPPPPEEETVFIQLPAGVQLREGTSSEEGVLEVNVPPGVKIEVI